jgi:hypothetical protein
LEKLLGPVIPLPDDALVDEVEGTASALLAVVATVEYYEDKKRHVEMVRSKVKRGLCSPELLRKLEGDVKVLEGHVARFSEDLTTYPKSDETSYIVGAVTLDRTKNLIARKKALREERKKAAMEGKESEIRLTGLKKDAVALEGKAKQCKEEFAKAEGVVNASERAVERAAAEAAEAGAGGLGTERSAFVVSGKGSGGGRRRKVHVVKHRARAQSGSGSNWGDGESVKSEGMSTIARGLAGRDESNGGGWSKPVQSLVVMSKENDSQLALARIEKKKKLRRERFNELELLGKIDRQVVIRHLCLVIASLTKLADVKMLLRNVFRTRRFHGSELAFKAWAVGTAMQKREKRLALGKVVRVVRVWGNKRVAKSFNVLRRAVATWKQDNAQVEFAAKTKVG